MTISRTEPSPAEILDAVTAILTTIANRPTTCPQDGCLLIGAGPCPACEVRKPRRCGCGRRMKCEDADECWVCLRVARMSARRVCGCGVVIRTNGAVCSRCLRRPRSVEVERSFRWVPRGGIMRPVFDEVA